ncbi:MAG: 1-deoxy-D-xylulose-5-phosphate synthase [Clostridia bacterium]|nr:1-deoxy-D-xylulose-5-phosphate synthase [Clostridia bacterium]
MDRLLTAEEVKKLSSAEARAYCAFLRSFLVEKVTQNGGHLASNLGIVEISVALARGMDQPSEKVIYDTGHQAYVHKILTGRGEAFDGLRTYGGISGFPRREESEFDAFGTGHSGTGISAALGFAEAGRLKGQENWCVAVIGDGAFTGGMVFEALNNISPDEKLIIILNDNGMSISKSVGRFRSHLNRMRTAGYYRLKREVKDTLSSLPLVGGTLVKLAKGLKTTVKRSALPMGNLFEEMGLHYFGPADGNDLETVELLLREAKKKNRPAVLHLCTKKGKGYAPAEENPSRFHGISPKGAKRSEGKSASAIFGESLTALGEKDPRIVGITAAMCDGVGMAEFAKRFPQRFFDVGIAEEHAVTFGAALAAEGMKPCFAVYSTFYQRAVDQLLHDAALQKLPLVLALDRAGISGEDGATHHGVFDLPLTLPIPGIRIFAPASEAEMKEALSSAFSETARPCVIRYAKGPFSPLVEETFPQKGDVLWHDFGHVPPEMGVVTFGRISENAVLACRKAEEEGLSLRLIRFSVLKGFDPAEMKRAFAGMKKILFVEEGVEIGGFSHYLSSLLEKEGYALQSRILAIGEGFVPHGNTDLLLERSGLGAEGIRKEIEILAKT